MTEFDRIQTVAFKRSQGEYGMALTMQMLNQTYVNGEIMEDVRVRDTEKTDKPG